MSRGAAGAAIGVAGTTVYLRPDIVVDWARSAVMSGKSVANGALDNTQINELTQLVQQLTNEVRGSRTVIVNASDNNSSRYSTLYYALTVTGLSATIYLVFVRGWRLGDLCYVTQRTFRSGITSLTAGLDSVSTRVADLKARVQQKLQEISRKQDEAASTAAAMRAQLAEVGADVECIRGQVGHIHSTIGDISTNQKHSLYGIALLCKAVGELAAGSTIPSKQELLEFTESPLWQRIRPSGLEGILREANREGRGFADGDDDFAWSHRRYMLGGGVDRVTSRDQQQGRYLNSRYDDALLRGEEVESPFKVLPPSSNNAGGASGAEYKTPTGFADRGFGGW